MVSDRPSQQPTHSFTLLINGHHSSLLALFTHQFHHVSRIFHDFHHTPRPIVPQFPSVPGFLAFCILLLVHCSRQSSYSYAQILAESDSTKARFCGIFGAKLVVELGMDQYLYNTIFRGMNIHLPAILMFTRGTRF